MAWAAFGDANLDGQVSFTDINLINGGGKYGQVASTDAVWAQGDFNYSGTVTFTDISLLNGAGVYGKGSYWVTAPSSVGTISTAEAMLVGLMMDTMATDGTSKKRLVP